MTTIHLHEKTTATPRSSWPCLTDFGPVAGTVRQQHRRVSEGAQRGPHDADVTEGSNGIWERLHY